MEWNSGDLEAKSSGHKNQRYNQQGSHSLCCQRCCNSIQIGCAGEAIKVTEAEEHQRSRHAAEEIILQCCVCRLCRTLGKRGQYIERKTEQLKRDKDYKQVARCRHQQHAGCAQQYNRRELARIARELRVGAEEKHQCREDQDADLRRGYERRGNQCSVGDAWSLRMGEQPCDGCYGTRHA